MRRAGRVVGYTQGVAIVRCHDENPPTIGTRVVDQRLERVGKVVDVFGPTDRPYLAISPQSSLGDVELLGEVLYIR